MATPAASPRGQLMQNRPAILPIDRLAPRSQGCSHGRRITNASAGLPGTDSEPTGEFPSPFSRHTEGSYDMKDDIVIVAATRTPVGAFNGAFASLPAHELGKVAIQEALKRAAVEGPQVSEVILGQILTAGQAKNPARQASVAAGSPEESPAW